MKAYSYISSYPSFSLQRKSIVIDWEDGRWGEAAPLDGYSSDNLKDVLSSILLEEQNPLPPSLSFAKDAKHFAPLSLPICGLLTGTKEKILHDAHLLHQQGLRHVKLKLKGLPLHEAISLANQVGKYFLLRIDFNRSLELPEALYFATHIDPAVVEFFEEPLKNPKELPLFPYPIALDESLREDAHHILTSLEQVRALVIKPTMTGNIANCKRWSHLGIPIVLSSSFESGIGIIQIMQYASHLSEQILPLGLDTYRFLEEDLLEHRLIFDGGFVHSPDLLLIKHHLLNAL
ncbi:MAG: hypothetical protein KGZ39_03575 [Simkania sp.]|nr:hypothetical protein [Simkania sp.]